MADVSFEDWRVQAQMWHDLWTKTEKRPVPREAIWGQYLVTQRFGDTDWGFSHADYTHLCVLTHFHLRWADLGYPVFMLSHGLAAKLLLTDCGSLTYDQVGWPFDSFVVQLPGPDSPITYLDGRSGLEVPAAFMGVHRFTTAPKSAAHYPMTHIGMARAVTNATQPAIMTLLQASSSRSTLHRISREPTDAAGTREFLDDATWNANAVSPGLTTGDVDQLANKAATRLAVNLALYLGDLHARGEWSPVQPAAKRRAAMPCKRWQIGQEIKLAPELRRMARSSAGLTPAWRLEARFVVRGHWRHQAVGPRGAGEHKLIWVSPYVKGPEAGERLDRTYRVGGAGDGGAASALP